MAIILATGLGFYFELQAGKEFEILNKVRDDEPVEVIRDGSVTTVPKSDIVVGDIVRIDTGQEIPADGDLLEALCLTVDESALTGEPSCHKTTDAAHFDHEATFPSNRALRGSKVMEGHGIMRVTQVGDNTEDGKVFTAAQIDGSVKTPLNEQLERLGSLITKGSYLVAALIVIGRVIMYFANFAFDWVTFIDHMLKTIMISVTLVVVAVPEGLPMAVTLSLAYSMRRMLRANNLVRKLHACETMGAATVICTDKTGTLTQNRMQVRSFLKFGAEDNSNIIYEGIASNSTAELNLNDTKATVIGNPTEGALLLWLNQMGVDYSRLRSKSHIGWQLPFNAERKYMATLVNGPDGSSRLYVKGAPEIIMEMCRNSANHEKLDEARSRLTDHQRQGMRTLGIAFKDLSDRFATAEADMTSELTGMNYLGTFAISDPVRNDVPEAIETVQNAGIKVKIVTGDTPATAREIATQIGLWQPSDTESEAMMNGAEFANLPHDEALERAQTLKIIARARPLDKKRLVELLEERGEVVAVTGDGTNDAPALKAAHVGLSMGDGTAVAKEASDITIIDNSFASIEHAVMWGRSLYRNIQRFIMFQLTVNVAACLIVLIGSYAGIQSPLNVIQMLWVNLIMDSFAAVALASLPPSNDVMHENPRNRASSIISPQMARSIIATGVIFFIIMGVMLYYFDHTDLQSLTQIGTTAWHNATEMNPHEVSIFFTTFVLLQFWNMFNVRAFATGKSIFSLTYGKGFVTIMALILFGQVAIIQLGGPFMGVVPLSLADWLIITISTSTVALIGEAMRRLQNSPTPNR